MSSCFQNAWLLVSNMTTPIITFRERPCMPSRVAPALSRADIESVKIRTEHGILVEWFKDGAIQETLPNGDTTIFPAKPTVDVFGAGIYSFSEFYMGYMTARTYITGNYFEFHSDGSVIYRHNGSTFLWSREFPGREVAGHVSYSMGEFDPDSLMYDRRDSFS